MSPKYIKLTKQDFDSVPWQEVIHDAKRNECHFYSGLFAEKARDSESKGLEKEHELFSLFSGLTSMMLRGDSKSEPFSPWAVFSDRRSAIIDDFDAQHVKVLSQIAGKIADPELRARVNDVLWVRTRNFKSAESAIDAYLESAKNLEHPKNWTSCADRIDRALKLSVSLGRQRKHLGKVISHIEAVINRYKGNDPLFLSNRMMEFLLDCGKGDAKVYAKLCVKIGLKAERNQEWYRARAYWETKARWHEKMDEGEEQRDALRRAAATYIGEAEAALQNENPSYFTAAAHIEKAIEAYRRNGGEQSTIENLHGTLLRYQNRARKEMKGVSTPVDFTEVATQAINRVKGRKLYDAIFELCLLTDPINVENLKNETEKALNDHPFQRMISQTIVNDEGRNVAKLSGLDSGSWQEPDSAFHDHMLRQAQFHHMVNAQGIIIPACNEIIREHNIRVDDIFQLIRNNPLVPQDRELLYAKGLHSGFEQDFFTATHLLIPQFENSVRSILSARGVIVSKLDNHGIQEERDLNSTLYFKEIPEIFGNDISFDLRCLLISRIGANLRNRMAHGLMSDRSFYSNECIYLWWLVLRLVCTPLIMNSASQRTRSKRRTKKRAGVSK